MDWHCLELELRRREAFYFELVSLWALSSGDSTKGTPALGLCAIRRRGEELRAALDVR